MTFHKKEYKQDRLYGWVIEFEIWVLDSAPQVAICIFSKMSSPRVASLIFNFWSTCGAAGPIWVAFVWFIPFCPLCILSIVCLVLFAHRRRSKENAICDTVGTPQTTCLRKLDDSAN